MGHDEVLQECEDRDEGDEARVMLTPERHDAVQNYHYVVEGKIRSEYEQAIDLLFLDFLLNLVFTL